MNPIIKERWLEALTSGEYKQTDSYLYTDQGFCCLGVLTDLYIKEKGFCWNETVHDDSECHPLHSYDLDGESEITPASVVDWAGLGMSDPEVKFNGKDTTLSQVNDKGYKFNEIALIIKEQL